MFATPEESRDQLVGLYRRVWMHSDTTVAVLPLTATGRVPWWPSERATVTLHTVLVHMIAEGHRHAGHADIVREHLDGAAGALPDFANLPDADAQWWSDYRARLEARAKEAADRTT
jgi:hypothetical protein